MGASVLYKYMRFREGFFEDPKLRVTQRLALNDPFEMLPSGRQVSGYFKKIADEFEKKTRDVSDLRKVSDVLNKKGDWIHRYTSPIDYYGCISLADKWDNILLWSHYGDQHKGVCIGLDSDFLGSKNELKHSSNDSGDVKEPQEIMYSEKRDVNEENEKDFGFDYFFDSFFVKSEAWRYEKEFRVIMELKNADEIQVSKKTFDRLVENRDYGDSFSFLNKCEDKGEVVFNGVSYNESVDKSFFGSEEVKRRSILSGGINKLANEGESLFFVNIPVSAIKEICFGCNFDRGAALNIIKSMGERGKGVDFYILNKELNCFGVEREILRLS